VHALYYAHCTAGITEALVTMGANDFRSFVVGYFVELSIAILQRLYLDPAREELSKLWPRWRMLLRRRLSRRRRMTREEKAKVRFLEIYLLLIASFKLL
jgi:hypothetical protein